jgi:hypothetical protein
LFLFDRRFFGSEVISMIIVYAFNLRAKYGPNNRFERSRGISSVNQGEGR